MKKYIWLSLVVIVFLGEQCFASDLSLIRLLDKEKSTEQRMLEKKETDSFFLHPKLGVGDDVLRPSLTFSSSKELNIKNLEVMFEFTANTGLKLEEAEELVKTFVVDGGDINFNFSLMYKPITDFVFELGYYYALITTDELSLEKTVAGVDSEVSGLQAKLLYSFNGIAIKYDFKDYKATSNGSNTAFNQLLDNEQASVFGVTIPFKQDAKDFLLKFERAKSSSVKDSTFRVAIETQF
ncbi:hypothetical protein [Aliikangiella sp. IMCC44359]|uniref:hypothetical protein n=1 Tax=Aliikangiella sp. IMCC44359 TaxID=3459125 RepID=UPI00403A9EA5